MKLVRHNDDYLVLKISHRDFHDLWQIVREAHNSYERLVTVQIDASEDEIEALEDKILAIYDQTDPDRAETTKHVRDVINEILDSDL